MRGSLRRLLEKSIDYAGMFPPASLGVVESLSQFQRYRTGPEAWILDRFVCLSDRLAEFCAALDHSPEVRDFGVAVIGQGSAGIDDWGNSLESDAELMNAFLEAIGHRVEIEAYEARIPEGAPMERALRDLLGFRHVDLYAEIPLGDRIQDALAAIAESERVHAKARTGGADPMATPSPSALAEFLHGCVSLELPFKLTAGLHQPFSSGRSFGFVNAIGGTALALAHDLSAREIEQILVDPSPTSWTFDDHVLRWGELDVPLPEIDLGRELFVSFGSCSVEEPIEALVEAGTLEPSHID